MKNTVRLLRLLVSVADLYARTSPRQLPVPAKPDAGTDKLASERLRGRVEYWKQVISIQMHFNDMCIRTRWLGLTAIGTLLAAAAVTEKENIQFAIPLWSHHTISLPSVLIAISSMVLIAVWALDKQYYYKMLIATVEHAESIERDIVKNDLYINQDGITSHISKRVSRRRAAMAARGFYLIVAIMQGLFLAGSLLPHVVAAVAPSITSGPSTPTTK